MFSFPSENCEMNWSCGSVKKEYWRHLKQLDNVSTQQCYSLSVLRSLRWITKQVKLRSVEGGEEGGSGWGPGAGALRSRGRGRWFTSKDRMESSESRKEGVKTIDRRAYAILHLHIYSIYVWLSLCLSLYVRVCFSCMCMYTYINFWIYV